MLFPRLLLLYLLVFGEDGGLGFEGGSFFPKHPPKHPFGFLSRNSPASASFVDARFQATGNTQVKPQQQSRGRSEMMPKSSAIMARFLRFQGLPT